jgi:N-formylglutamate deformylase
MKAMISIQPGHTPLVLDSPHSGTHYPKDFGYACDFLELRQCEDTYVSELFAPARQLGVSWLEAHFPRSYIDANRACNEIDADMIEPQQVAALVASEKIKLGAGLIWRQTLQGQPVYKRKLSWAEVEARINTCWKPYHDALSQLIHQTHELHGLCIHLNCHSMPSKHPLYEGRFAEGRVPDFILGSRDETSASPRITALISQVLSDMGYKVLINQVFKGAELTRAYAQPSSRKHSIQIEINRGLYMDERTFEKKSYFFNLQNHLRELAELVMSQAQRLA